MLPHGQNTVYVNYRLVSGVENARLMIRPSLHFRPHEDAVSTELDTGYVLMVHEDRYEVALGDKLPALRFLLHGSKAQLTVDKLRRIQEIVYRIEERRGYPARGDLWSSRLFSCGAASGFGRHSRRIHRELGKHVRFDARGCR